MAAQTAQQIQTPNQFYLRAAEIDRVKFSFSMYENDDKLDSVDLPIVLRGLNFNPSVKQLDAMGVKETPGAKYYTVDDVVEIYRECKKNLQTFGTERDFVEVLEMMDKYHNGKVGLAEISGLLVTLGEPLEKEEMDEVMKDCMPEEDDNGLIDYMPFLKALCGAI